jgi:hypothetical protein
MIILRLDKNGGINKGDIKAFEHDNKSETYIIQLYKNNKVYDLTNKTVELTIVEKKRKYGDMVTLPVEAAAEGKVKLEIVTALTKQDGTYDFKLTVKDTAGLIETFPNFQVKIDTDITKNIAGEIVEDKNFTILTEGLKALSEYEVYKTNAKKVPDIEKNVANLGSQLDNKESKEEVARKAYIEYVDTQDSDLLRQIGQGVTDEQLKNAVQSKIDDGSIPSLSVGEDSVRPVNLNNGSKAIQPIIWRISESSIIKSGTSITIGNNVGCLYRDKYIYATPETYTFSETDSYLVLRDVILQNTATTTHTPIIVKRGNVNESDIILAYYSTNIMTIWDGVIAEYLSITSTNKLTSNKRTAIGSYGYISSRFPFNIDIVNKQIVFNTDTYICYNTSFIKITNTTVDITNALSGGHLYYDLTTNAFTVIKPNHEDFVWLGTIWINPLVVGLNSTNGFTVNGMTYNQTISRWNGQVLNAIGDSITYGVGCTIQYHQWLKQLCGFKTVNNYGVSGSTIARRPDDSISWDTATALVDRINLIDKTAKVTTVFMGVNDFITGRLLGTFDSTDVTTFYGALHYVCKYFRENMPDKIVTFITPMQFNWEQRPPVGNNIDGTNKNGNTLLDFVNVIKEVCGFYGYTVLDMYHNCFYGLSDTTVSTYMPDKLHVNDLGHKEIMAPRIASHINSH